MAIDVIEVAAAVAKLMPVLFRIMDGTQERLLCTHPGQILHFNPINYILDNRRTIWQQLWVMVHAFARTECLVLRISAQQRVIATSTLVSYAETALIYWTRSDLEPTLTSLPLLLETSNA
jgi:hypothetical protein